MVSIGEVVAKLGADIQQVEQQATRILGAKELAEELREQFASMGIADSRTGRQIDASIADLDNALAQNDAVKATLERAREQVQKAEYGLTGQSGASGSGPTSAESAGMPRGLEATIGDPLEVPHEIADSDGDVRRESRLSRLGRVAAKSADSINAKSKTLTDNAVDASQSFRRLPDGPSETSTGTVQHVTAIGPQPGHTTHGDVTSTIVTLVLGGVVLFKSTRQRRQLRKGQRNVD